MDLTVTLLDRLTGELQGNSYDGVDFNKLFYNIDFSSDEISSQSYKNIARILGVATKNETIDKTDILVAFLLLAKQTLVSNGLDDVKINYIHKNPEEDANSSTYYSDKDKTLNIFFEDILNEIILKKLNAPIAPLARVVEIVRQINIMKQEVKSAQQFELFRLFAKNPNLTPSNVYISQKQYLATVLSKKKGKYLSYDLLTKTTAENGLSYGDFSKYGVVATDTLNESDENFSMLTNPKLPVVSTSFMASVVLCDVLRKLSKEDREVFQKDYSVVFFAFNNDGTRKNLAEIENDRQNKLKATTSIKDKKQQELERNAINKLYETIIETDAILSLERCLTHIENLSWESERFFVPKNEDNKYSPTSIREEMKLVSEKAQAILSLIEGDGIEFIEPILKSFEKNILDLLKDKKADKTFLDDKKHYMFAISNLYFKNDDLKAGPKDKVLASDDKRKEIDRAVKTLKIVFPSLLPNPTVFGVAEDGKYIELPNIEERIMLDIAWENYRTAYITKKDEDPDLLGVEPIDLQRAIRIVYPYNEYSIEKRNAVEEQIREGEISLVPNLYEVVTEKDFYGDEIEDEEMIVDTDDETDYNRFFVIKDQKEEVSEKEKVEDVEEESQEEIETIATTAIEEIEEKIVKDESVSKKEEVEIVEEKPQETPKEEVVENKGNEELEKLAEDVGKVINKKTQNAISSIEEVVSKKQKQKEENKKAPKTVKSGKNVNQQFAEFEKVLGDADEIKAELVELEENLVVEEKTESICEKVEETKEDATDTREVVEEKSQETKTEEKETTQDSSKEEVAKEIDNLIETVDDLIVKTDNDSDDETDLGKKEEVIEPQEEMTLNTNETEEVEEKAEEEKLEESNAETGDEEVVAEPETEEENKKEEKPQKLKINITKEKLEEGDKLTGEELLEKYFKFREQQEKEEAEKERLRAEALARGEPYGEDEEVKIPVEPTKEDVYESAIEIEDVSIIENKDESDDES